MVPSADERGQQEGAPAAAAGGEDTASAQFESCIAVINDFLESKCLCATQRALRHAGMIVSMIVRASACSCAQ